jgi:hypothetical protein
MRLMKLIFLPVYLLLFPLISIRSIISLLSVSLSVPNKNYFSMRSLAYQRKVGDYFFSELLVFVCFMTRELSI